MQNYKIRFNDKLDSDDYNTPEMNFVVVEFPPIKRMVLRIGAQPLHLQIPYFILGFFYKKYQSGLMHIDKRTWEDTRDCYSRVVAYFNDKPMQSLHDYLAVPPFSGQDNGRICFGDDENVNKSLYQCHKNLNDLIEETTRLYWSTPMEIYSISLKDDTIAINPNTWEDRSKQNAILDKIDWHDTGEFSILKFILKNYCLTGEFVK